MSGPSGTVTFLFTDIEGSTRLWESVPAAMRSALARHDALLRSAIEGYRGYVFATGGDGLAAAFARAGDAAAAAGEAQRAFGSEDWGAGIEIRVRMGLHTGEAEERDGDYFGPPVNQAARLMAIARGGQVVCSAITAGLLASDMALVDLGVHRLRDLSAPQRVFQVGPGRFQPLRTVDTVPTNLPTVRSELIGRSEEVAAVTALLEQHRLVTLTGVGGVGKTRLAIAVAAASAMGFADGCWFVELAPLGDGAEVVGAVADALGAPVSEQAALVRYLSERRALIVLDNCEHLVPAVAGLVDEVLEASPDVHIVATSREPLGVEGEHVRLVPSLALPPTESDVGRAGEAASVRLFVERGAAARDGFRLDTANVGPVVEICRRLDGLPLAIELAAARVRAMPPTEIAHRLGERFKLLEGGSRRAHERHRTLLATVSWSHDLLDDDERRTFRRLAVFPASFTLEAAQAVAVDGDLDGVRPVLGLVDRSLVQFDPDEGRYHLLETLRQYGADRLADAGETEAVAERHARFFLGLAADNAPRLTGPAFPQASSQLTAELENLRAAAEWCVARERWRELRDLCRDTFIFAALSRPDSAGWYQAVIDNDPELRGQDRVEMLAQLAYVVAVHVGVAGTAESLAIQSDDIAAAEGIAPSPTASLARAMVENIRGDADLRFAQASLEAASDGDEFLAVLAYSFIANAQASSGHTDAAKGSADAALRGAERIGNPALTAIAAIAAASSCVNSDDPDFAASIAVFASHANDLPSADVTAMWCHLIRGHCLVGLGSEAAYEDLAAAARLGDRLNAQHVVDQALRGLAAQCATAGHLKQAARLLGYAEGNLATLHMNSQPYRHAQGRLADALSGHDELAPARAEGAGCKRGDIMALVNNLESMFESASEEAR